LLGFCHLAKWIPFAQPIAKVLHLDITNPAALTTLTLYAGLNAAVYGAIGWLLGNSRDRQIAAMRIRA